MNPRIVELPDDDSEVRTGENLEPTDLKKGGKRSIRLLDSADDLDSSSMEIGPILASYIDFFTPRPGLYVWSKERITQSEEQLKYQIQLAEGANKMLRSLLILAPLIAQQSDIFSALQLCTYFLYDGYPWSIGSNGQILAKQIMQLLFEKVTARAKDNQANAEINAPGQVAVELLSNSVKTAFTSSSKHYKVSHTGRQKLSINERRSLDTEEPAWKFECQHLLSTLEFCLRNITSTDAENNWSFFIPTILNLIDDHEVGIKAKGCDFTLLLSRRIGKNAQAIWDRTGVNRIFIDSIEPCLLYLPPSVSPSESAHLLSAALPALIEVATRLDTDDETTIFLDTLVRRGILKGMSQAGSNIELGMVLMEQLKVLIERLGINVVRHLKPLTIMFVSILSDPFAAAYLPYLDLSCDVFIVLVKNSGPRAYGYRYDILRGIVSAWFTLQKDDINDDDIKQKLQALLKSLFGGIDESEKSDLKADLKKLQKSFSGLDPLLEGLNVAVCV